MTRTDKDQEILERFGLRLRELRQTRKLTQEEFAAKVGFSRSYYTEIETGKRNLSLLNLHKIACFLEITLAELLSEI